MRFSLNLPCLYAGKRFAEALPEVRAAGFDTVECWTLPRGDEESFAAALEETGVRLSAFCPDFFILNDETRHDEYEENLRRALQWAKKLRCPALITQVGADTGAPRKEQHAAIVKGLRRMAPLLREAGVTLLVEPLNDVKDHKGYYLTSSQEGFDIIREVNDPNVRLLFDIYHQVHMGEDVQTQILENLPLIGHFHIAAHPNRDEKIFTNFDYAPLFTAMAAAGCTQPLGLELRPETTAARDDMYAALAPWRG